MKVAVFLPNWVGDVVMATPALRALRSHFGPHAQLTGVLRSHLSGILAGTSWLNEERLIGKPENGGESTFATALRLRRERYDTVVLFTNSWRTGLAARLSGASTRVGDSRYGRGLVLTHALHPPTARFRRVPTSTMLMYLKTVELLGCQVQSREIELNTLPGDEAQADAVWDKLKLPAPEQTVVFHVGGGWGGQGDAKSWPTERFAHVARRLHDQYGLGVLVICGPSEQQTAARIAQMAARPGVASLAGEKLSFGLSKACVRRSRLMLTTDSGPRHFAAAFDVPVVTLFGPTNITWSETHYEHAIHLQQNVPCGPCQKRTCPLGHHRCMNEMTTDTVMDAVVRILDMNPPTQAGARRRISA